MTTDHPTVEPVTRPKRKSLLANQGLPSGDEKLDEFIGRANELAPIVVEEPVARPDDDEDDVAPPKSRSKVGLIGVFVLGGATMFGINAAMKRDDGEAHRTAIVASAPVDRAPALTPTRDEAETPDVDVNGGSPTVAAPTAATDVANTTPVPAATTETAKPTSTPAAPTPTIAKAAPVPATMEPGIAKAAPVPGAAPAVAKPAPTGTTPTSKTTPALTVAKVTPAPTPPPPTAKLAPAKPAVAAKPAAEELPDPFGESPKPAPKPVATPTAPQAPPAKADEGLYDPF